MVKPDNKLIFDPKSHKYTYDGKVMSGVTSVISSIPEELALSAHFMRKAALGTEVHEICERINLGKRVAMNKLNDDVRPYVIGWKEFLKDHNIEILLCEQAVYHEKLGYAGTLDLFAMLNGIPVILDLKTVSVMSSAPALQLAAYNEALFTMYREGKIKTARPTGHRIAVQLLPNGGYNVHYYPASHQKFHFNVFTAKLMSSRWDKGFFIKGNEKLPKKFRK